MVKLVEESLVRVAESGFPLLYGQCSMALVRELTKKLGWEVYCISLDPGASVRHLMVEKLVQEEL